MSHRTLVSGSLLTLLASCAPSTEGDDAADRRRPRRPDAGVAPAPDAATLDAPTPSPAEAGVISCYRETLPTGTCTLPEVCCFTNYSAQHNGYCTDSASACTWGSISCDGPEDCGSGQSCCAQGSWDSEWGMQGWTLACSAAACGAPPLGWELCHPGGAACAGGKSCVSAYGVVNDLPRTLYVCN